MNRLTARNKMMDYIARRDHSEKELRQKLRRAKYSPEEIEKAIEYGKSRKWIPDSEDLEANLSNRMAEGLHRKKKGILFINSYLSEKGLPEVQSNSEQELEKALNLVENKYRFSSDLSREEKDKLKAKIGRFLISRGYETSIVRKVIYEKLRN